MEKCAARQWATSLRSRARSRPVADSWQTAAGHTRASNTTRGRARRRKQRWGESTHGHVPPRSRPQRQPERIADRVTRNLSSGERPRLRTAVLQRLEAPESLAIERRGRLITIASSRAAPITFEADGREQIEQSPNGRSVRTRPTCDVKLSTAAITRFRNQVNWSSQNAALQAHDVARALILELVQAYQANGNAAHASTTMEASRYSSPRSFARSSRAATFPCRSRGSSHIWRGTRALGSPAPRISSTGRRSISASSRRCVSIT